MMEADNPSEHKISKPFNIIVVDDKPANLRLLEKMLTEKKYRVRPFPRGRMAIDAAFKDPPDLFLLDINMPEMDGFDVCRQLKKDERTSDIPIIFISALTSTDDKIRALGAGGVDYITKPFQFEEVHARVETHLHLKDAQQKLKEKNKALEMALAELHAAKDELAQSKKMAALGVLTAGIAHEINNPVNFIKTSALGLGQDVDDFQKLFHLYRKHCHVFFDKSILEEVESVEKEIDYHTVVEEIPALINNIHEGVRRTEDIVNSLRLFARSDDSEKKETDIHELIDASLVILRNKCKTGISVQKKYGSLPKLKVHSGKMVQVFTNIISNAIDAIRGKSGLSSETITIETRELMKDQKSFVSVCVKDSGPGIPNETLDRIFDPFYTTKDVGKGTGLGLSISIGIIKEHKGDIQVNSEPGKGAAFTIFLPI